MTDKIQKRNKHEIDADDRILGRLATEIAGLLRGKHKVDFDYHLDNGDFVVVANVKKIKVSGNKLQQKLYRHHSGYPGGLKEMKMEKLFKKDPTEVLKRAVYNMLPKNKLRQHMIKRLTFK